MDKTRYERRVGRWEGDAVVAVVEPLVFTSAVMDVRFSVHPTAKLHFLICARMAYPRRPFCGCSWEHVSRRRHHCCAGLLTSWNGNLQVNGEIAALQHLTEARFRSTRVAGVWFQNRHVRHCARKERVNRATHSRAVRPLERQHLQRRVRTRTIR